MAQPGGMRRAGMARNRDIDGTILGAPAEGTRTIVRGDSVSGQAGRGEATSVVSLFLFVWPFSGLIFLEAVAIPNYMCNLASAAARPSQCEAPSGI